jgi:hypothetical protein
VPQMSKWRSNGAGFPPSVMHCALIVQCKQWRERLKGHFVPSQYKWVAIEKPVPSYGSTATVHCSRDPERLPRLLFLAAAQCNRKWTGQPRE